MTDYQYETNIEQLKSELEVHRQGIGGKDINRIHKDNFYLRIEKDSLVRFLASKNLLDQYQEWAIADIQSRKEVTPNGD